jgi:methyltransferase (TIGR00027 family)
MADASDGKIEGVSDTALWVAHFRALESARPTPAFRDPLAALLVGERGRKIAESMPLPQMMSWIMVLRTCAIDRLVLQAVELGVDTVVNLGAGMDTRPYRMPLPASLRWVEIDFAHSVDYKNEKLKDQKPNCRLERLALDLEKQSERKKIFRQLAEESKKILVITEGLIPYLTKEEVSVLSQDLHFHPQFRYWIQDYNQGDFRKRVPRAIVKKLQMAPFRFQVDDWFTFFQNLGWRAKYRHNVGEEAKHLNRWPPFMFPWTILMWLSPQKVKARRSKMSGYTLLERV